MDYELRLAKLRELFVKQKLSACLITSTANIFYFTGISHFSATEREAFLFVTPIHAYLLTDARYTHEVAALAPHLNVIELTPTNTLKTCLTGFVAKLSGKSEQKFKIGAEDSNLSYREYYALKKFLPLTPFDPSQLRVIKSSTEIEFVSQACRLGDELIKFIYSKINPGISESELAWEMEKFLKDRGASFSFDPIVAFGLNSASPHHQTGQTILQAQEIVQLDVGVKLGGYCSDVSRVFLNNNLSPELLKMYKTVFFAQHKVENFLDETFVGNPHIKVSLKEVEQVANDCIQKAGYPSIPHALGHGIGIQVHEAPIISPKSSDLLQEGMVFTIEPGIYIPGLGGVRVEDVYAIQNYKYTRLSHAFFDLDFIFDSEK